MRFMQKRNALILAGIMVLLFFSLASVKLWRPLLGKTFITGRAPLGSGDYGSPDYCLDTCESLNYNCGIQVICGNQSDCGSCQEGQACTNGRCTAVRCVDTDTYPGYLNGINYYKKGTAYTTRFGITDNCGGDILTEYFCSGSLVNWTFYNCSQEDKICEDGVCIESTEGAEEVEGRCGDGKCEGSIEATLNSGKYANLSLNGRFYFVKAVVLGNNSVQFTLNGKNVDLLGEKESESVNGTRIYVKEIEYYSDVFGWVVFILGENYESCSWDCGCNETDKGIDIYNKGEINYYIDSGWREATDGCRDKYLTEFACSYYTPQEANPSRVFECEYGCWDGKCLEFQEAEEKIESKEAYCGDGKCGIGEERNIKKGEVLEYVFNGEAYRISTNSSMASEVVLSVNGELTDSLEIGEEEIVDGLLIYLKNIWYIYSDFSFESIDVVLGENLDSCPTDCMKEISKEEAAKILEIESGKEEIKTTCGDGMCDKGVERTIISGESVNFNFKDREYKLKAEVVDNSHADVVVNEQIVRMRVFENKVIDGVPVYLKNIEYSRGELGKSVDLVLAETEETCPQDCVDEGIVKEFYKGILVRFIRFFGG